MTDTGLAFDGDGVGLLDKVGFTGTEADGVDFVERDLAFVFV